RKPSRRRAKTIGCPRSCSTRSARSDQPSTWCPKFPTPSPPESSTSGACASRSGVNGTRLRACAP
ncbi:unnamed protein product, partial [Ectocarpus fasciculatus]